MPFSFRQKKLNKEIKKKDNTHPELKSYKSRLKIKCLVLESVNGDVNYEYKRKNKNDNMKKTVDAFGSKEVPGVG